MYARRTGETGESGDRENTYLVILTHHWMSRWALGGWLPTAAIEPSLRLRNEC